ncbi:MAG: hypothetical protein ACK5ZH_05470 [Alphaproteobacteria bacterium]|jgi:hypothetical protein
MKKAVLAILAILLIVLAVALLTTPSATSSPVEVEIPLDTLKK